jgi:hypothetical protein
MQLNDWHDMGQHAFACQIDASPGEPRDATIRHHLTLAFNPGPAPTAMRLGAGRWQVVLDSSLELAAGTEPAVDGSLAVPAQALVVLRGSAAEQPAPGH